MLDFLSKSNHIGQANTNETVFFDRHPVYQAVRRFFYAQFTGVPYDRMRVAVTPRNDNRLDCVCNILSPKGFLQTSLGGLTQANETKNATCSKVGICPKIKSKFQSYCGFSSPRNNGNPILGERFTNGFRSKAHLFGGVA